MNELSRRFSAVLNSGRQSHSYIIEGGLPDERKKSALDLASMLLCEKMDGSTAHPCGVCKGCRKVAEGVHPDLVTIEPQKGMIRIDSVKEVVAQLKFPPLEAHTRAIIIFDADRMNPEAANTILKTLEEPPRDNCFFLVVPSQESLLPTIRSRCQILTLRTQRRSLYEISKGEGERFLELLEEVELERPEPEKSKCALEARSRLFELLTLFYLEGRKARAVAMALSLSKEISKDRDLFSLLFFTLKTLARDMLTIMAEDERGSIKELMINPEHAKLLSYIAKRFDEEEVIQYLFRLEKLEKLTRRGINLEYAANAVLLFWLGEHE